MTLRQAFPAGSRGSTKALDIQGTVFAITGCGCGVYFAVARFAGLSHFSKPAEAFAGIEFCALLILLLGAPHGALDIVFAERSLPLRSLRDWGLFVAGYLLLAASVVAFWKGLPLLFLAAFLLLSTFHFSGDLAAGTPMAVRLLYGGAIVVLPALFHGAEVRRLFDLLTAEGTAEPVVMFLGWLAWPWMASCAAACAMLWRLDRRGASEILATLMLAVFAPPLLSFTIFFCLMHSARHILRTLNYCHDEGRLTTAWSVARTAIAPMAGLICLLIAAASWLTTLPLDQTVVQLAFVSLAALTVPHMVLIEPVRFARWHHLSNP